MKKLDPLHELPFRFRSQAGESQRHNHLKTPGGQEIADPTEDIYREQGLHVNGRAKAQKEALENYTDAVSRKARPNEIDYLRKQAEAAGATDNEIAAAFDTGFQIRQGSPASVRQ